MGWLEDGCITVTFGGEYFLVVVEEVLVESELDLLLVIVGRDVTGDKELPLRSFISEQSSSARKKTTKLLDMVIYGINPEVYMMYIVTDQSNIW